jgi:imidazole glycerol-phosphate synthase subunit HisH
MSVAIIDYKMSNLGSVKRAFQECGADAFISSEPIDLENVTHIVLPGVGAFANGINNLKKLGWIDAIKQAVLDDRIPILGICLGMQLLADKSFEKGETEGLCLIPGDIIRLEQKNNKERIPHIGWNEIHFNQESSIFKNINNDSDFYFVHSFHFSPKNKKDIVAKTPYCGGFVSAVQNKNIFGVQFHPEKSSRAGFQLIQNFLNLVI